VEALAALQQAAAAPPTVVAGAPPQPLTRQSPHFFQRAAGECARLLGQQCSEVRQRVSRVLSVGRGVQNLGPSWTSGLQCVEIWAGAWGASPD